MNPDDPRPSEPAPAPTTDAAVRHKALGHTVARGMGFMVLVGVLGKLLSTVAVIVLGTLLSPHHFALFGIAFGLAGVIQILRDGGLRQIAIQRGPKGFERLSGPVGWLSLACNSLAGLILVGIAPIAVLVYNKPELMGLILVSALGAPLVTFGSMSKARLEVQMRYGTVARINTWNNITRYAGQIALAGLGFGAYSFVIPTILVAIVDGAMGHAYTRSTFLTESPRIRVWKPLLSRMRWTIAGTVGHATINRADYVILGYFVPLVIGFYFFAFQIALQINTILAFNLQKVLFPTLTRVANEPERHRQAALRAMRSLALISSAAGAGLACVFPAMERMIWAGKWSEAVVATQLMSLAFPLRMPLSIHDSVVLSKGEFKSWAAFLWVQGAGLIVAALVAGLLFQTTTMVTLVIAAFYIAVIPAMIAWRLGHFGIPPLASMHAMFMPWILSVIAALPMHYLTTTHPGIVRLAPNRIGDAGEILITGTGFVILYALLVRTFAAKATAELLRAIPGPAGRLGLRLARL